MESLAQFFQTNRVIVYFLYGEAFFVLGLSIALQSRKHSQLALAKRLWLLAVFGLVHGVYEWGAVFIPIQQTYLPVEAIVVLRVLQLLLGAVSFFALFQFGVGLIVDGRVNPGYWSALPGAVMLIWTMAMIVGETKLNVNLDDVLVLGDVLARYMMAVPGALAAAWGLWRQANQVDEMDLPRIARSFRGAAYAFIGYAIVSAITPRADLFPASVINYDSVIQAIGVPVPVFRAVLGATIAYLIIHGSEIFDVETDRLLEEVGQARAIAVDRERIGRELHDGIIQSLYAAGLILEDATLTIDEDAGRAQSRIRQVIDALNRTIADIRRYILDLRGENDQGDWQTGLGELVRAFRLETLIEAQFQTRGTPDKSLTREKAGHLLTIVREALNNVKRHARATRVDVTLDYRPNELELDIRDNGVGFSQTRPGARRPTGEQQGIRNMQERATLMGARIHVHSAPNQGTLVRVIFPHTPRT